jgi:protein-ribulosamine 3-kinase
VSLPRDLQDAVESAVGMRVANVQGAGSGSISNTARVDFTTGERVLLKWVSDHASARPMLVEEARSLKSLAATRTVRVPDVLFISPSSQQPFLLLEWLEPGPRTAANQRALGEQLAALHRHSSAQYGWITDNFIGSLPQSNRRHDNWADFWREERLAPQLAMASAQLGSNARRFQPVVDALPDLLGDVQSEGPSLLHGDLWSGNMHMLADGSAAVIDPSTYYGHREVDIAMTRLFGGFSKEFYEAYASAWPYRPGVEKRIALYQLYYVLVHVNLFGGGYVGQAIGLLEEVC